MDIGAMVTTTAAALWPALSYPHRAVKAMAPRARKTVATKLKNIPARAKSSPVRLAITRITMGNAGKKASRISSAGSPPLVPAKYPARAISTSCAASHFLSRPHRLSSLAAAKSASVDSRAMLPTLTIMAASIQLHAAELVDVFLATEVSPGHRSSLNTRTIFDAGRVSAPATLSLATSSPATSSEATSPDVTPSGGCAEVGLVLIAHDRSAPPDWQ